MKFLKAFCLAAFGAASFGVTSCGCCTGDARVLPLRPLPELQSFEGHVAEAK